MRLLRHHRLLVPTPTLTAREPILLLCEQHRVGVRCPEQTRHPGCVNVLEHDLSQSNRVSAQELAT